MNSFKINQDLSFNPFAENTEFNGITYDVT